MRKPCVVVAAWGGIARDEVSGSGRCHWEAEWPDSASVEYYANIGGGARGGPTCTVWAWPSGAAAGVEPMREGQRRERGSVRVGGSGAGGGGWRAKACQLMSQGGHRSGGANNHM